ncbi:peptidylprolyl isomerase [Stappia taiwanensis]|nr:SurA N-terminal domain-containing protein [Stappia taiwanensis]
MTMMRRLRVAAMALLTAGLLSAPAMAKTSIKVLVNDRPITSYDIAQRAGLIRLTTRVGGSTARRQATEELINDELKLLEASRRGVSVSKAEVDAAFATLASRVKLSPKKLSGVLRQSGVNPETLRDRLRAEIAWGQIIRGRFQAEVRIEEADVIAALQRDNDKDAEKSMEYRLQSVIFVVPAKASSGQKSKRKGEAQRFRSKVSSCDQAATLAKQFREVVVMPTQLRLESELPDNLRKAVAKTAVGKLTAPESSQNGYEMIAVCDKREIASDAAARAEVEDELRNKEGQQLSRRYLRELRRKALIDYR